MVGNEEKWGSPRLEIGDSGIKVCIIELQGMIGWRVKSTLATP